jgi:signal peptidase
MDNVREPRNELECRLFLEVLSSFGEARLKVTGSSMLPTIWPGDVLEVRHQGVAEIQSGDVVLFQRQGQLVAHRVVQRLGGPGGNLLITRGDRQSAADPPITKEELLGRVTEILCGNHRKVPRLTFGCWVGAWILSRSDFLTRVSLHLSNRLPSIRRFGKAQWAR